MEQSFKPLRYPMAALALTLLTACDRAPDTAKGPGTPPVTVAKVIEQPITEWDEVTARLEAPETVEVRPRVSGQIERVAFTDGGLVKKGDLLFQIDPRPFEHEVHRFEAQLQQARATLVRTANEAQRGQRLLGSNAISAELAENRTTTAQEAKAGVDAIQAQLDLARLNLSFTRVTAPITGRVSRAKITAGNIVTADTTPLTNVVSTDKVYAYLDVDERLFLKYSQLSRNGQRGQTTPVYMGLSNEQDNAHLGQMDFVDNQVNPHTGTIRGRAVFDNADGQYTPGLYARLRLVGSAAYAGLLIKDEAVGTDLGKKFVLVVDQDNKVVYRNVELGPKLEGLRIVRNGLQKADRIVINGLQRVRPGAVVAPQNAPMADPKTIATLTRQRHAFEAGNQPVPVKSATLVKTDAAVTPRG
ncbi:efflux RND transporter periplasmic adaptor subunit [Pseudomonas sp. Irchel 3A7]|uniref:efflux RND transporter periplasmic adaptor subunit n=1 Tax=Pseudomonas sp. Irchel 3A7 TaxID=2008913 RepID=UPI000BA474C4|nr:efflux RND transporter periplasmic adaptor subunit [Pseudomonas sp. Irchel 3A7]